MSEELQASQLRCQCDPSSFDFESTDEVSVGAEIVGQPRATAALEFGLGMDGHGYHVFVAGPHGTGKMTAVNAYLAAIAQERPVPEDLCYVENFRDPERPRALRLPAGRGRALARAVAKLVEITGQQLPRAFESDEYTSQRTAITQQVVNAREEELSQLRERAGTAGFALQVTPMGLVLIPLSENKPMSEEEFAHLSSEQRTDWQQRRAVVEEDVSQVMKRLREREAMAREAITKLDRDVALHAVGGLLEDLIEPYADLPLVGAYLNAMRDDMVEHVDLFREASPEASEAGPPVAFQRSQALRRYQVNVVVDRSEASGAPVINEVNPTYQNLIGHIEKEAQFGVLSTDFTLIRSGALHRANGGYLVLRAEDVLRQPLAWEGLKRALETHQLAIEEPVDVLGLSATRTLHPEPVPLDLKVILVGEASLYSLLYQFDPAFRELFRVRSDFDHQMPRTLENTHALVRFVSRLCQQERLPAFDRSALAALVEQSSRLAEDQEKLSVEFGVIADLVRQAAYWARHASATLVSASHVKQAIAQQLYRSNLLEERLREMVAQGTLLVATDGAVVGQVNGLAVQQVADHRFGMPSRITAVVAVGREGVLDIEREVKLGGPIHSKGVLILAGFLMDRFAQDLPLALSARLAFEQNYGGVEGDSASSAELYALLSRLADVPIKQSLAVTGSVNQRGEIQAIGGVNEKIEGFFATCKAKGLTGDHGVLIPAANVRHLMLRDEVVEAVRQGQFHVYPVSTVDDGIALLTGVPAGVRGVDGCYPKGSVNARVQTRLGAMAQAMRALTGAAETNGSVAPKTS